MDNDYICVVFWGSESGSVGLESRWRVRGDKSIQQADVSPVWAIINTTVSLICKVGIFSKQTKKKLNKIFFKKSPNNKTKMLR